MNPFYFIASIANASTRSVKLAVTAENRAQAFIYAADVLFQRNLDTLSVQSVNVHQFNAAALPSAWKVVGTLGPIATQVTSPA
jgi:uncharacterized protein (UPF0333 family)